MKKRLSTNNIEEEAYNRRIHETVGLQGGNAMDLRIEKTEKGIRNAFIELRSRKPLEKITIKELCEHAYINKSTFYSHDKDIYDLSERMEEEVVSSITNSSSPPEYIRENPAEFTRELFLAYLSQNSLITILFSGSQRNHLADRIETSIKEMIFRKHPEYRKDRVRNIILSYCIQGGYHAFQRNRDKDMQTLISVISDLTEVVKPLYEAEY